MNQENDNSIEVLHNSSEIDDSRDQEQLDEAGIAQLALEEAGVIIGYGDEIIVTTNPPKKPKVDRSGKRKKGATKTPKGGRGHFSQHIKTQLTQSGKLNANEAIPIKQKRARRRKRK